MASVFPDDLRLFLHVIHTVYKHCMFVRTDEPHVIRSSSELTNPISLSSLTNLISLLVPLHKLSLYLVLCKMTRNCSVCKQYGFTVPLWEGRSGFTVTLCEVQSGNTVTVGKKTDIGQVILDNVWRTKLMGV